MSRRHLAPLISLEDFATSPPAKTDISSSILSTPTYCTSCKATIPQSSAYKWCFRCREKDRERQKRKKARRALVEAVRRGEVIEDTSDHSGLPPKKKLKKETKRSVQAPQEKYTRILPLGHGPDVPIGDKVAAYVKARRADEGPSSTLGKRKARQTDSFLVDIRTPFGCYEFQSSTELHGVLAAKVKEYYKTHAARSSAPPRITFQGCYSIVMDPDVPHSRRIELESKLVRKISKLPHSSHYIGEDAHLEHYQRVFPCRCSELLPQPAFVAPSVTASVQTPSPSSSGNSTPLASTSSQKGSLKRQQSDLSKWILRQGTKATPPIPTPRHTTLPGLPGAGLIKTSISPSPSPAPTQPQPISTIRSCGGNITITVVDDYSHLLGAMCKGQKVIITIEHPPSRR